MDTPRYYHNNVGIYIDCYMFLPSLPHHHAVHSSIKQLLKNSVNLRYVALSQVHQCTHYGKGYVHSNWLLQLLCTYPYP